MLKQPTFSSPLIAANVYFEKKIIKNYGVLGGENQSDNGVANSNRLLHGFRVIVIDEANHGCNRRQSNR